MRTTTQHNTITKTGCAGTAVCSATAGRSGLPGPPLSIRRREAVTVGKGTHSRTDSLKPAQDDRRATSGQSRDLPRTRSPRSEGFGVR